MVITKKTAVLNLKFQYSTLSLQIIQQTESLFKMPSEKFQIWRGISKFKTFISNVCQVWKFLPIAMIKKLLHCWRKSSFKEFPSGVSKENGRGCWFCHFRLVHLKIISRYLSVLVIKPSILNEAWIGTWKTMTECTAWAENSIKTVAPIELIKFLQSYELYKGLPTVHLEGKEQLHFQG